MMYELNDSPRPLAYAEIEVSAMQGKAGLVGKILRMLEVGSPGFRRKALLGPACAWASVFPSGAYTAQLCH
jgi:hypothetical protein